MHRRCRWPAACCPPPVSCRPSELDARRPTRYLSAVSTLRSSASVSAAVLASRVLGVARDALFAAAFGVSSLTDAYVVAFRIPNLLRDLFAEGALSSAFVPTFAEAMAHGGRERAYRLGNLVFSGLLVVTGAITVAGVVWGHPGGALPPPGVEGGPGEVLQGAPPARG